GRGGPASGPRAILVLGRRGGGQGRARPPNCGTETETGTSKQPLCPPVPLGHDYPSPVPAIRSRRIRKRFVRPDPIAPGDIRRTSLVRSECTRRHARARTSEHFGGGDATPETWSLSTSEPPPGLLNERALTLGDPPGGLIQVKPCSPVDLRKGFHPARARRPFEWEGDALDRRGIAVPLGRKGVDDLPAWLLDRE